MKVFLASALALASLSNGQSSRLTLEQALELADRNSPALRESAAIQEGAQAGIVTARAYPNPQFSAVAGHQSAWALLVPGIPGISGLQLAGIPGVVQNYSASQPVEMPAVRRTRIQVAQMALTSSKSGAAGVRLAVRAQVKHAFYEVLHRKEEIEHARESLALVEDLRRRTAIQVSVGELGRLELTRAEAELAIAQTALRGAQLRHVGAVSALRVAISAPASVDIDPAGDLDSKVTVPQLDEARGIVLANHPAVAQARAEVERAQAQLANEKALRFPQYTTYGEYEIQPGLRFFRFGVSVPVPIWDKRKGQIAEAGAAMRRAEALQTQRQLELTAALERSYGQYQLANQQVESFQAGSLRQAEAALTAAQAAYRFGERGIMEVLDAQRVLQSVRGDYLDARFERQNALIDLEELGAVSGIGGVGK